MPAKAKDTVPNKSAAIVRKYRRVIAIGCTHGDLADKALLQQVLDFKQRYKPELVFELGDIMDTAAFRSGARGTSDEGREVEGDEMAAIRWLERYEPTHLTFGNHEWRLQEWMNSPNAVVAHAAKCVWEDIQKTVRKLKCQTRPYDYEHGWFEIGGTFWGHGYAYNQDALRDQAEYLGSGVVQAHLHKPHMVSGRTRKWTQSFCVGTLAQIDKMNYARRRRATSLWGAGCVWGEVASDRSQLWLASAPKGERLRFPI